MFCTFSDDGGQQDGPVMGEAQEEDVRGARGARPAGDDADLAGRPDVRLHHQGR